SIEYSAHERSSEEKETYVTEYLKAVLHLVYCGVKGLEGWQFIGTPPHEESKKTQSVGKINVITQLIRIMRNEIPWKSRDEVRKYFSKKDKKLKGLEVFPDDDE
ncbi:MAG: hypothetical protein ACXAC7_07630, partial [Candidatus Hodarchaeales archaeon]